LKLFVWGHGYVGSRMAQAWSGPVAATSRRADSDHNVHHGHVRIVPWPMQQSGDACYYASQADVWLVTVPPVDGEDPVLDCVQRLNIPIPPYVGYLSATSVYGGTDGCFRDENSPLNPSDKRGMARVCVEDRWRSLCADARSTLHIYRLAGIYGPGRDALARILAGQKHVVDVPGQVMSRIHVDDIVSALVRTLGFQRAGGAFNLADNFSASTPEVTDFACGLLGREPLAKVSVDAPFISENMRGFYMNNRRILARRLKEDFFWRPKYPSYKEGLRASLDILKS